MLLPSTGGLYTEAKEVDVGLDHSTLTELSSETRAVRERLLHGISWFTCGVLALVIPLLVFLARAPALNCVVYVGGLALLLSATTVRRLPFALRVGAFVITLYSAAAISMLWGGYTPNAFLAFGLIVVVTTLVLGRRAGFLSVAVSALTLLAISGLHGSDIVHRASDWAIRIDDAQVPVMIRVVLIFSLVTSAFVVAISYLLARSEQLALGKIHALTSLEAEQAARIRAQTDLLERESAFRKAQELEILGRLAGSMGHDFNNALLVIAMAVDEIDQRNDVPKEVKSAVDLIRQAGAQAATATRALRAFGRYVPGDSQPTALGAVTERTGKLLERLLPSTIEIQTELDRGLTISSNEALLQRLLTNLALNARDAMRDGGRLTLRVRRARQGEVDGGGDGLTTTNSEWIALDVEDTGTGMPPEIQSRAFEPYFTTKDGSGTGLGLFSVRESVEAQGGRVGLRSEVGVGTRVSIYWPRVETADPLPAPATTRMSPGNGITVLVVEDELTVRTSMVRGLSRLGFRVLEAKDAESGLLISRRYLEDISVLCCDFVMPGLPVHHLIEGFRTTHPTGRVLLCSGNVPEKALSLERIDGFLAKPFGAEALAQRIEQVLARDSPTPMTRVEAGRAI